MKFSSKIAGHIFHVLTGALIVLGCFCASPVAGQDSARHLTDTLSPKEIRLAARANRQKRRDSVFLTHYGNFRPKALIALGLSTIIPGGGEFYNRSYWAAGIIAATELALLKGATKPKYPSPDKGYFITGQDVAAMFLVIEHLTQLIHAPLHSLIICKDLRYVSSKRLTLNCKPTLLKIQGQLQPALKLSMRL